MTIESRIVMSLLAAVLRTHPLGQHHDDAPDDQR